MSEPGKSNCEKRNDDPLESDEIIVHVSPRSEASEEDLSKLITKRFVAATEISPNKIEFHNAKTLRSKQGVGKALKEEKVVDRRVTGESV